MGYGEIENNERFLELLKEYNLIAFEELEIIDGFKSLSVKIKVRDKYGECEITPLSLLKGAMPKIYSAIDKDIYFMNQLKEKNSFVYSNFEKISKYNGGKSYITFKTKFGELKAIPNTLLSGRTPDISMAINKHEYFLNMLKEKNKEALNFKFLDKYTRNNVNIRVEDKYGIMKIKPNYLLMGIMPSIQSAINKHDYYLNMLKEKNLVAYNELCFLEEYKKADVKILAKDKYGIVKIIPDTLLMGFLPNIKCAVDKHSYFLNMLKEVNPTAYNELIFTTKYTKSTDLIYGENKYGKIKTKPCFLLSGRVPNIDSAIDKNDYFLNFLKNKNEKILKYSFKNKFKSYNSMIYIDTEFGECKMSPTSMINGALPDINSAKDKVSYSKKQFIKVHGERYDYSMFDKYKNSKSQINIICKKHGIFSQAIGNHKNGQGCPTCCLSKGELEVSKVLNKLNVGFVTQKTFKDCKNIKRLPFDFYLVDKNICIEFQGKQHYHEVELFGGTKQLKLQKKHDEIKRKFCEDANILLIEIKYTDFDKIEKILIKELDL